MAGWTSNGADDDIWVRKYDSTGTELWTSTHNRGGHDFVRGMSIDELGHPIVTGHVWNGTDDGLVLTADHCTDRH